MYTWVYEYKPFKSGVVPLWGIHFQGFDFFEVENTCPFPSGVFSLRGIHFQGFDFLRFKKPPKTEVTSLPPPPPPSPVTEVTPHNKKTVSS